MAALIYGAIGFTVGALISLVIAMASSNVMKTTKNANILMAVSSDRGRKEKTESNGNEEDADGI